MGNRANNAMNSLLSFHTIRHVAIGYAPVAGTDPVEKVECGWNPNRTTWRETVRDYLSKSEDAHQCQFRRQ